MSDGVEPEHRESSTKYREPNNPKLFNIEHFLSTCGQRLKQKSRTSNYKSLIFNKFTNWHKS